MTIDFTISEKPDIMTEKVIPSVVFIIPYRNRENDKIKFMNHMKYILQKDLKSNREGYQQFLKKVNTMEFRLQDEHFRRQKTILLFLKNLDV